MKRTIFYLCILLSGAMTVSCDLDLEPKNAVTFEHFFKTEEDLFSVVAEIHGELRETLLTVPYHEYMGAIIDRISGAASVYERLRNLDPNTVAADSRQEQWKKYYNVITLADLFMDNYHKAEHVDPERLNFCLGQCYFAKAVCYMYLGRIWGDAVITKGSLYSDKYAKSPAEAVIDTAIAYAHRAYDILPKYSEMRGINGKMLVSKQYGCKGSAAAVLAHLYAWKGSLQGDSQALREAEAWCSRFFDPAYASEIGTYTLAADPEEVCQKTLVRTGEESIFEAEVNFYELSPGYFLPGTHMISYPVMLNSQREDVADAYFGIYLNTVNKMYRAGDKRRTAYFYKPDDPQESNTLGLAYLYKWRNTYYLQSSSIDPIFSNMDCNKVLIRLADICLLRAECRVKLGDMVGAADDLNRIRDRAGANLFPDADAGETDADLQLLVFREREKELLLEGQRYYDVVRNGNDYVRRELSEGFAALTDMDIANGALYLPVPRTAFTDNDLMIQNTYWLSKMK